MSPQSLDFSHKNPKLDLITRQTYITQAIQRQISRMYFSNTKLPSNGVFQNLAGRLLEIPRSRTVAYKNSFYVRAPSVWSTLPKDLRDTTRSVSSFKTNLCQFYNKLLDDIFDPEDSRTYKTVCIKCHSTRSLLTLSTSSCC